MIRFYNHLLSVYVLVELLHPNTIANVSFSICEYLCCVSYNADDAYAIGLPTCTMVAPSNLELLSTVSTIGLVSSKYASTGTFVHFFSSMFGNFFPVHLPSATLLLYVEVASVELIHLIYLAEVFARYCTNPRNVCNSFLFVGAFICSTALSFFRIRFESL